MAAWPSRNTRACHGPACVIPCVFACLAYTGACAMCVYTSMSTHSSVPTYSLNSHPSHTCQKSSPLAHAMACCGRVSAKTCTACDVLAALNQVSMSSSHCCVCKGAWSKQEEIQHVITDCACRMVGNDKVLLFWQPVTHPTYTTYIGRW